MVKKANELLEEYIKEYPFYTELNFSSLDYEGDTIPKLLVFTQLIIDELIKNDNNRIAILLPTNDINVFPMIITKYFNALLSESDYSYDLFSKIEKGQKLSLGKAVFEFVSVEFDEKTKKMKLNIKYGLGTKNDVFEIRQIPFEKWFNYLEKTEAKLTKKDVFNKERVNIKRKSDTDIDLLKSRRTTILKTIVLFTARKIFNDISRFLLVNNTLLEDIVTFGPVIKSEPISFNILNDGHLDVIVPSITICSKFDGITALLFNEEFSNKINYIFVFPDKLDEINNNVYELKNIDETNTIYSFH